MALKPNMRPLARSSRWLRFFQISCSFLLTLMFSDVSCGASSLLSWNFDVNAPDTLPREFVVGTLFDGRTAGDWKVVETEKAKSAPHVLGQLMGKGAEHAYKTVLINGTSASDIDLQVSFLSIEGKADMGGGLLWRAIDDRNYYLTRANPLEQNIRIYRVVKGVRHLLQNFDLIIEVKQWHTLRVTHHGCRLQVFYDERTGLRSL